MSSFEAGIAGFIRLRSTVWSFQTRHTSFEPGLVGVIMGPICEPSRPANSRERPARLPGEGETMINLVDIRYVRLGTRNLDETVAYATDTLGLELVGRENGRAYVRGDDRNHNICYFDGDPGDLTLAFEVLTRAELDAAAAELESTGHPVHIGSDDECADRRVLAFINFRDPTGNGIDLVLRPFHSGVRYFPSRDAGITGFNHVGLRTTNAPRDEEFWCKNFNIRVSDWLGPCGRVTFDQVHHRIALFPSDGPGVQRINHQVESIDALMRSWYFLSDRQIPIRFGPGRHPPSTAMFVYFAGPDDMTFEYSTGVRMITDPENDRPRQYPAGPAAFCMWGAMPDIPEFQ